MSLLSAQSRCSSYRPLKSFLDIHIWGLSNNIRTGNSRSVLNVVEIPRRRASAITKKLRDRLSSTIVASSSITRAVVLFANVYRKKQESLGKHDTYRLLILNLFLISRLLERVSHLSFHSHSPQPDLWCLQREFQIPRLRVKKITRRLVAKIAKLWKAGAPSEITLDVLVRRNALQTIRSPSAPTTGAKETIKERVPLFVAHIHFSFPVRCTNTK